MQTLLLGAVTCCQRLWAFVCFLEVYLLTRPLFGGCQASGELTYSLAHSPHPVCILFSVVAGAMGICLSFIEQESYTVKYETVSNKWEVLNKYSWSEWMNRQWQ